MTPLDEAAANLHEEGRDRLWLSSSSDVPKQLYHGRKMLLWASARGNVTTTSTLLGL